MSGAQTLVAVAMGALTLMALGLSHSTQPLKDSDDAAIFACVACAVIVLVLLPVGLFVL